MAIAFARMQYVQRSRGQKVCHKAAYYGREKIKDYTNKETFDYSHKKADLVYNDVLLPQGMDTRYKDPQVLWNTMEALEKRQDAQTARDLLLALPNNPGITDQHRQEIARSFVQKYFVDKNLVCQLCIHQPKEGDKDSNNPHAHVLIATRTWDGHGFSKNKARHLDVDVRLGRVMSTDKQWGRLFADHQKQYFQQHHLNVAVDPNSIVPQIHLGPTRLRGNATHLVNYNEQLKDMNARYALYEDMALNSLLRQQSSFSQKTVDRFIEKHIDPQQAQEFRHRFFNSPDLVLLEQDKYTSKSVVKEERKLHRVAQRLVERPGKHYRHFIQKHPTLNLSSAQKAALHYITSGPNLVIMDGKAGTGKSAVLQEVRDAYQNQGFTVRGLAPTSYLANNMKKDGFKHADNLHSFLFSKYNGRLTTHKNLEVWLVDEAAMVNNTVMTEMLTQAWYCGAKVVLVGDERQLTPIGRGGAFHTFKERYGAVTLDHIRRQHDPQQRSIVSSMAKGYTQKALKAMDQQGTWQHHHTEGQAIQALMDKWFADYEKNPFQKSLILEYRQEYVSIFNEHIHKILQIRGEVGDKDVSIYTTYGFLPFSVGDQIVMRENDTKLKLYNGMRGVLVEAKPHAFTICLDDEKTITFNPQVYKNFHHGYASTIHCAQGVTVDRAYVMHAPHQTNSHLFYVSCSRHRMSCDYFSYGSKDQVFQDVARTEVKQLCEQAPPKSLGWVDDALHWLRDRFMKNHSFYTTDLKTQMAKGVVITDTKEKAQCPGHRTLYREDQHLWPELVGQPVRLSAKHHDLEATLRDLGVPQCIDLHTKQMLIGPYDRFGQLGAVADLSPFVTRVRLHALEQKFGEAPKTAQDMVNTQAYQTLCHNEQHIRPQLKVTNPILANCLLYQFEQSNTMPTQADVEKWEKALHNNTSHHATPDIAFTLMLHERYQNTLHAFVALELYRGREK